MDFIIVNRAVSQCVFTL